MGGSVLGWKWRSGGEVEGYLSLRLMMTGFAAELSDLIRTKATGI
jgi:hypothetical protein